MAGPGGAEIGRVSVRVLPDTTAFGKSLARYLQRVERTHRALVHAQLDDTGLVSDARRLAALAENAATVLVPTELDDARVETEFRALVRRLSGESVRLSVDIDENATRRIQQIRGEFAALSAGTLKIAGVASTIQSLAGLGVAAAQASGSLLLLPAAGVAAGAVFGTLALGVAGFGDAMKNLDDPAKFAEAVGKLAPAAREAATAVREVKPAFDGLRLDVQQRLFAGVGAEIEQVATAYLPVLRTGLGGIAGELNIAARSFSDFATSPATLADTSTILGNVRAALGELTPAGTAAAQAFRDIAAVGSGFLPQLAAQITAAAQRFAEFIAQARQSGQLAGWMQGGITAVGQLWQVLKNLASIVTSVFTGLDSSGGGFLSFLVEATGQVAAFLKSAEGMAVLQSIGRAASVAGEALSGVLGTALDQLAPVVVALLPAFSEFATQLGSALVTALQIAGPLLQQLATFLSANASWLAPVVVGLGTLAAVAGPLVSGLTVLANAVRVVTLVFNAMKIALLSNPFTAIAVAVAALAVLIITNWSSIRDTTVAVFNAVWGFIKSIWQTITGWISARVTDILNAIGWLASLPGKVADWFGGILSGAVSKLGELVSWVGSLPGKILGALGDLGSLLLDAGKNIITGLLNGLKNAASAVIDFFKNLISDAVDSVLSFLGISSPSKVMHRIGGYTAQGFAYGIRDATPLAAKAAGQLANAATFDPTPPSLGLGSGFGNAGAGSASPVTVNQTINPQPEQSPWAIATAANRQLGYAMRTNGLP